MDTRSPDAEPLLSILIPAYNFPAGIRRALDSLGTPSSGAEVEIIVSDDSSDAAKAADIECEATRHPGVEYRRNPAPLGAVHHWNALLARARGEYCLLLHHDEFLEPGAFQDVLRVVRARQADGVVLPCTVLAAGRAPRRNMPVPVAELVVKRWPGYLLRRNVLGAPSVLVLRRSMYEPFDERLRWWVDVECYARAFAAHRPRLAFLRERGVMSDLSLDTSITNSIQGEMTRLRRHELGLLRASATVYGSGAWMIAAGVWPGAARCLEAVVWKSFRLLLRLWQRVHPVAPHAEVRP